MPALADRIPSPAVDPGIDLHAEIQRLKRELNAVILAHYYQIPEIQDAADHIADSLKLAQEAARTDADVIVFAGVHFMAETAKILNPGKQVLLPDLDAGCSLADSCSPAAFAEFRKRHPDHIVVSYINCSAAIKAQSDIIVTSSNAEDIVRQIPAAQPIIFAPDRNLGHYLNQKTGRGMVLWNGSCIVHEMFSECKIQRLKAEHPDALVLAHPECEELVLLHADHIGSTASIRKFARESDARKFIVVTEPGLLYPMKQDNPDKVFIPAPPGNQCACSECPHMKRNTLAKLYTCMRDRRPELTMEPDLLQRARRPIDRMLELSR